MHMWVFAGGVGGRLLSCFYAAGAARAARLLGHLLSIRVPARPPLDLAPAAVHPKPRTQVLRLLDEIRDRLVPLNKKYPIKELLEACRNYPGLSNARRITFEYVMLKGVNDSREDAKRLVQLLKGIPAKVNLIPFNHTATATLNRNTHSECMNTINAAAGLTLTLPAASGSGDVYRLYIGTTVTSNNVIIRVANASDTMSGLAISAADGGDTANAWETASDTDTITLNGTTKGGVLGDVITLEDVAANKWSVQVVSSSTSTEASPFSAAVA